jgi:hypothetical protein
MVIFVLAACAVFFLSVLLPPPFDFPWPKKKWQVAIGVILLCGVLLIFLSLTMPLLGYRFLLIAQRLTGAEATQLLFGMVFGAILRYWGQALLRYLEARVLMRQALTTPAQGTTAQAQARGANPLMQPYACLTMVLLGLLLVAAAAPYMGELFGGVTGLKTPIVELQFAPKRPEERPILQSEREKFIVESLTSVLGIHSYTIPGDLLELKIQEALLPETTDLSSRDEKLKQLVSLKNIYIDTDRFIEEGLLPITTCTEAARSEHQDLESLRAAIRPVAQELWRLIRASQSQDSKSMKDAHDMFVATLRRSHQSALGLVSTPARCTREFPWKAWPNELKYIPEMAKCPHIHLIMSGILRFNGNIEGEIALLHPAAKLFSDHAARGAVGKINYFLSQLMYLSERSPESVFKYLDEALRILQEMANRIDRLIARTGQTSEQENFRMKLKERKGGLELAGRGLRNTLAYMSAKIGDREMRAILDAKDNYDNLKEVSGDDVAAFVDTYGYVKMSFAARKDPPVLNEIQQARALFLDAISYARSHRGDDEADEILWKQTNIIRGHLSEAERILNRSK